MEMNPLPNGHAGEEVSFSSVVSYSLMQLDNTNVHIQKIKTSAHGK